MYLEKINISRMTVGEFIVFFLGSQGIGYLFLKFYFEKKKRDWEQRYLSENDEREHQQKLELLKQQKSERSLSRTIRLSSEWQKFLNVSSKKYEADFTGLIKLSNGKVFGDGTGVWKYSLAYKSDLETNIRFRDDFYLLPFEEVATLYASLKETGYIVIKPKSSNLAFSNRLIRKDVGTCVLVSSDSQMNVMMVCYKEEIEIAESHLKEMCGDFKSTKERLE